MADLLIRGVKMPLRCEDCNFCEDVGGLGCSAKRLVILRRHGQDKPSWCPLVELPPEENRLYICDPSKADGCSKTGCAYAGGAEHGDCMLTTRLEWALMEERQ